MDRNNKDATKKALGATVALRKESVDRNANQTKEVNIMNWSLSARRAWIEIFWSECNYRIWKNPVISMVLAHQARGFYPNFFSMRLESYDKRFFQMM